MQTTVIKFMSYTVNDLKVNLSKKKNTQVEQMYCFNHFNLNVLYWVDLGGYMADFPVCDQE